MAASVVVLAACAGLWLLWRTIHSLVCLWRRNQRGNVGRKLGRLTALWRESRKLHNGAPPALVHHELGDSASSENGTAG